ncbi:MAG: SanA/YdcF family protein [Lachnospiraceae bacterium]
MKIKKWLKRIGFLCMVFAIAGTAVSVFGNMYVKFRGEKRIIDREGLQQLEQFDCIMVLGCGLRLDGKPTRMLTDRLDQGIALYQEGVAPKLLMSGDHGRIQYDEVNEMKQYAIDRGVPSKDIFMDHAGFSTYESMIRAREVFLVERMVVVTQDYHLYRAVYNANCMGIEAWGVAAAPNSYGGQWKRDLREVLARNKDMIVCLFQPDPTYLGEAIPVSGNGDVTNDKRIN